MIIGSKPQCCVHVPVASAAYVGLIVTFIDYTLHACPCIPVAAPIQPHGGEAAERHHVLPRPPAHRQPPMPWPTHQVQCQNSTWEEGHGRRKEEVKRDLRDSGTCRRLEKLATHASCLKV